MQQLETDPQDDFQVVSRSKGMTIKKKTLVKSNYITRNKTGNPEPFR